MKKSRSDSKAFEMSSLSAPRRVPVPVLVRDGKRCPSPSSLYQPAPDYGSAISNHHPTAFTSTGHNVHSSLMSAAAAHNYNTQYATPVYNQYADVAVTPTDAYLTNTNLATNISPSMASGMQATSHMTGFSSYNPQLVQQNCRWPW